MENGGERSLELDEHRTVEELQLLSFDLSRSRVSRLVMPAVRARPQRSSFRGVNDISVVEVEEPNIADR